jgi:hypothetical protein
MGNSRDIWGLRRYGAVCNIPGVVAMAKEARGNGYWVAAKRTGWAAIGLAVFVGIPEGMRWKNGGAFSNPSFGAATTVIPESPVQTTPAPPAPSGNFNINQQGGVNSQTYINQAPERLKLTDALETELLANIPKDKAIKLIVAGSNSDADVGIQIGNFLRANGYSVGISHVGILIPAPDHPLTWVAATSTLIVAPSAR